MHERIGYTPVSNEASPREAVELTHPGLLQTWATERVVP
jgi:hypothetical protein